MCLTLSNGHPASKTDTSPIKAKAFRTMSCRPKAHRQDALTGLLFRLPAELRQQIYEYLVPEASLLLLPETANWSWDFGTPGRSDRRPFRWLSVSPEVFLDAGPLFYSARQLYFWIDARSDGKARSLDDALMHHGKSVHPQNARWTFDILRSRMLTKVMLEIYSPKLGENLQSLLLRFAEQTIQFKHYHALKELHISLRPQYNNAHHKALFNSFQPPGLREKRMKDSWILRRLCRAVRQIKTHVPTKCRVEWYIPGKKRPKLSHRRRDVEEDEPHDSELRVIEFMESLWAFVGERTDEQLDELLSERESQVAWPS